MILADGDVLRLDEVSKVNVLVALHVLAFKSDLN